MLLHLKIAGFHFLNYYIKIYHLLHLSLHRNIITRYIVSKIELRRSNHNNDIAIKNNCNNYNNNFVDFSSITLSDLTSIINSMLSTSCPLDIIPTYLIEEMSDIFYPIILYIVNLSLSSSKFPSFFKSSIIIPTLKNNSLNPSQLPSYRPIANLSFIS